jgi:hypothetical protein
MRADSPYTHVLYGILLVLFAIENLNLLKELNEEKKKCSGDKEDLNTNLIRHLVFQNTALQTAMSDALSELKRRSRSKSWHGDI